MRSAGARRCVLCVFFLIRDRYGPDDRHAPAADVNVPLWTHLLPRNCLTFYTLTTGTKWRLQQAPNHLLPLSRTPQALLTRFARAPGARPVPDRSPASAGQAPRTLGQDRGQGRHHRQPARRRRLLVRPIFGMTAPLIRRF